MSNSVPTALVIPKISCYARQDIISSDTEGPKAIRNAIVSLYDYGWSNLCFWATGSLAGPLCNESIYLTCAQPKRESAAGQSYKFNFVAYAKSTSTDSIYMMIDGTYEIFLECSNTSGLIQRFEGSVKVDYDLTDIPMLSVDVPSTIQVYSLSCFQKTYRELITTGPLSNGLTCPDSEAYNNLKPLTPARYNQLSSMADFVYREQQRGMFLYGTKIQTGTYRIRIPIPISRQSEAKTAKFWFLADYSSTVTITALMPGPNDTVSATATGTNETPTMTIYSSAEGITEQIFLDYEIAITSTNCMITGYWG